VRGPVAKRGVFELDVAARGAPTGVGRVGRDVVYIVDMFRDTSENLEIRKTREKESHTGRAVVERRTWYDSTHYPPSIIFACV